MCYEDLIKAHDSELDRLFEFLEIESHESSNTISKMGVPYKGNSLYNIDQSAINSYSVDAYREKLHPSTINIINKFCRPFYLGDYENKKLPISTLVPILNPFVHLNEIKRVSFIKNVKGVLFLVFYFFRKWVRPR